MASKSIKTPHQNLFPLLDEPNIPDDSVVTSHPAWQKKLEQNTIVRTELAETYTRALIDDFKEHGTDAIVRVRHKNPATYLKLISQLLPKEYTIDLNQSDPTQAIVADTERLRVLRDLISSPVREGQPIDVTPRVGQDILDDHEGEVQDGPVLSPNDDTQS